MATPPNDVELARRTVGILDEYGHMYAQLSGGRASTYLDYIKLGKADESQLIQPTIFPEFLSHVLNFSRHLDYVPEKPGVGGKTPDFTPTDPLMHPFLFETKGCDSTRDDLISEFGKKSKIYLETHPLAKFVVITNMVELVVFEKDSNAIVDDMSFSFVNLYGSFKTGNWNPKEKNSKRFLQFVQGFRRKELGTEAKIKAIAIAKPHQALDAKVGQTYRELETLTDSIRSVVEWMRNDVKNRRGKGALLDLTEGDDERRKLIAMELFAIRHEVNPALEVPEKVKSSDLEKLLDSNEKPIKTAVDLYYYRVAYFTMARILLVRAWEDSSFIDEQSQTLYNGGFSRWYFERLGKEIGRVLRQAFFFAREKYEWLFTDRTNYSWYVPTDGILVDVLYELARYNLSVLNSDVLGTVYEEYLDAQDKKNKGQYYTPSPIVEMIWNRVGYGRESTVYQVVDGKRVPRKVFDPATGSGSFLVEAARRIRADIYRSTSTQRVEAMKSAIVNGLYGSEISPFSYYITEINLLIQLTPVVKKIVENDPGRREREGRFTLSVIRQDSLSLHTPPRRVTDDEPDTKDESYYGFEILKPTGDKLRVFDHIRKHQDFDYVVGNPPYIGEDDHKELFRRTLALFPYWKEHYQGKMDYLYFFVILGLQKLRPGGRLGFITTSYWLTADGAAKLRKYILENAKIVEIINFHNVKLFEHAPGQHNIVFVLEKTPKPEVRAANKIRLAEVHEALPGDSVQERLRSTCYHVETKLREPSYRDAYVSTYDAPVIQSELTQDAWFLFHSKADEELLKKIEARGTALSALCHVSQGVAPNPQKVDKATLGMLPQNVLLEGVKVGDGVFVMTDAEVEALGVPKKEQQLLRPFFKNSNVHRYVTDAIDRQALIYSTKLTDIDDFPTIKDHLKKFKTRLDQRRETQDGKIPWWSLHWAREERLFEGAKIVCPYRSPVNTFAFSEDRFYGSTDLYFIKSKSAASEGTVQSPLGGEPVDLLYVLGILNSRVLRLWTLRRTKRKGEMRELFPKALEKFPIALPDMGKANGRAAHDSVVRCARRIIDSSRELARFEPAAVSPLSPSGDSELFPGLSINLYIRTYDTASLVALSDATELVIDTPPADFILKACGDVGSDLGGSGFILPLKGKSGGQTVLVRGERAPLDFLKTLLAQMKGATKSDIETLLVPASFTSFQDAFRAAAASAATLWDEIVRLQNELDDLAYSLFGVTREDVDSALSAAATASEDAVDAADATEGAD